MLRQYLRTAILSVIIITTGIGVPVIYHSNKDVEENSKKN